MSEWTDTAAHKRVLRTSRTARKVRARFPAGTRVVSVGGAGRARLVEGTVYRHVPGLNAQGGYLVVDWDTGVRGRISPISVEVV